jgi:hypothetical protein
MNYNESPAWLKTADAHSIAEDGSSWFQDLGTALGNTPEFLQVSLMSGLNSFYNTGVSVGNIFREEDQQWELNDTGKWISDYDDNLGAYYEENKSAADLTGFLVTSLVPGLGAVKGLQAAQNVMRVAAAGEVGAGMRVATNLLAPSMETYVKRAGAELASRSATFSFANGNALRAVAAGTQQAVLESIAFESAVAATMFQSPLLSEMDGWDMVKNAAMGVGFGAGFGALGSLAVTYTGTQKLLRNADARALPFQSSTISSRGPGVYASDAVVNAAEDMEFITRMTPVADDIRAAKMAQGESGISLSAEVIDAEVARLNRIREENLTRLQNEARTGMHKTVGNDPTLANNLTDVTSRLSSRGLFETALNAKQIMRAGQASELDQAAKLLKSTGAAATKKEAISQLSDTMIQSNIRLHSGNIGEKIVGSPNSAMRLADKYSETQLANKIKAAPFKAAGRTDFRVVKNVEDAELAWIAARSPGAKILPGTVIGSHDLPVLDLAYRTDVPAISVQVEGSTVPAVIQGKQAIRDYLVQAKLDVLQAQKKAGKSTNHIEVFTDIRADKIQGTYSGKGDAGTFAQQTYADELSTWFNKDKQPAQQVQFTPYDMHLRPRFAKVVYDTERVMDEQGHVLAGMNILEHRAALAKQSQESYFASYAGERYGDFPEIPQDLMRRAWRGGSGAGFLTNAGGAYGSLEQRLSTIGGLVYELEKAKVGALKERLAPSLQVALTNPEVAQRFSVINSLVSRTPESYVLDEFGENLIPKKIADYRKALAEWESGGDMSARVPVAPNLHPGSPELIPLESDGIRAIIRDHIAESDARLIHKRNLSTATGGDINTRYEGVFRTVRPDSSSLKHVAFVKDNSMVGSGHTTMIWGKDGPDLERQIADINAIGEGHYRVYTRGDAEDFYKAKGEYDYDMTIHENYIDIDKASRGIMSNARPSLDPQTIVNDFLNHHVKDETAVLKQSVLAKYQRESDELLRLANQWERYNSSVVGYRDAYSLINSPNKNPYSAMIKSLLNATKLEEAGWWMSPQRKLDEVFSSAYNRATATIKPGKAITDDDVERVQASFQELGFKSAYHDVALELARDTRIDRGALTKFVRTANSFLTTTILRWDLFNSINTMVGQSILYSAEMKSLTSAIKKGSVEGAGELAQLTNIRVPGIEQDLQFFSPSKLLAAGMQKVHGQDGPALLAEMERRGYLLPEDRQLVAGLDNLTLSGSESVAEMNSKTAKVKAMWEKTVNAGATVTGNNITERLSKAYGIAAIKEVTDIAVKRGIMDDNTAWSYINTFNARVNGVIRASERPLMFQGPVGQAMGLFQSYQMNLLQQIFRNVGEGNKKALAYMAGMQASVFGASSLPGFSLINGTLVGNASGNSEHKDLFTAGQTLFGDTGAKWLMYGIPSNVLNASLYTRGDTNPRTWHVVPNPTNPGDIPFISGISQAVGSLFTAVQRAGDTGVTEGLLSGLEHAGLSRPLAGMAATARAFTTPDGMVTTTQKNGNFLYANDLWSWSTLVRLAGAKPIDEARTVGDYYRVGAYAAKDREKREELGTRLKLSILGGGEISNDELGNFAEKYAQFGGKQSGFNQWFMQQYKNASVSQAEQLSQKLDSPYSRYMQGLMGGRDSLSDLTDY